MTIRIMSVIMRSTLVGLSQIAFAQVQAVVPVESPEHQNTHAQETKDAAFLREIRLGHQELSLALELGNDQLNLANDGLKNDIAGLEGRPEDKDFGQLLVDRFLIDQDKNAIKINNWFAQVWFNGGSKELQAKLLEVEKTFEVAQTQCRPLADGSIVPSTTLKEAKDNCANLQKIFETVGGYQIKLSIPPPTIFHHRANLDSVGEKLLREDKIQLSHDSASGHVKQIKKELINGDTNCINLDMQIWLQEILDADGKAESVKSTLGDLRDMMITVRQQIGTLQADERRRLFAVENQ
jgi:hypothetical protein